MASSTDCNDEGIDRGVFYPESPFRASWLDAYDALQLTDAWDRKFIH